VAYFGDYDQQIAQLLNPSSDYVESRVSPNGES